MASLNGRTVLISGADDQGGAGVGGLAAELKQGAVKADVTTSGILRT